jgi:hypothetical protein
LLDLEKVMADILSRHMWDRLELKEHISKIHSVFLLHGYPIFDSFLSSLLQQVMQRQSFYHNLIFIQADRYSFSWNEETIKYTFNDANDGYLDDRFTIEMDGKVMYSFNDFEISCKVSIMACFAHCVLTFVGSWNGL